MKELAMQLRMASDPLYIQELPWEPGQTSQFETSNILCPNCQIEHLTPTDQFELSCECCGHEFTLIDNTVKFK